jgi:hypothetical protein
VEEEKMKTIAILAALLLVAMSGAAFGQATVACLGTESTGPGGTSECGLQAYVYQVTPLAVPEGQVYIPTHDNNPANYTNICAPAGWTFTIVPNTFGLQAYAPKTPHGAVSPGPGGPGWSCPYLLYWTGPPMAPAVPFEIGFDHPWPSHDVEWFAFDNGITAAWPMPVGLGAGPVHGPIEFNEWIPTMSTYGMILLALLLVVAGTLIIRRRRQTA